ncbi:MAG: hypothetical protein WBE58_19625, partial [Verrucomicrobiales bacterium]
IEALDPQAKGSLADPAVAQHHFVWSPNQKRRMAFRRLKGFLSRPHSMANSNSSGGPFSGKGS